MIRPMMVMTTRISTSVKPRSLRLAERRVLVPRMGMLRRSIPTPPEFSSDDLSHRQERGHDRDDQAAHHNADRDDGHGTRDPDHPIEAALQLGLVEFRDPPGEHRELP